jgi:hypothetical protein
LPRRLGPSTGSGRGGVGLGRRLLDDAYDLVENGFGSKNPSPREISRRGR